MTGIPWNSAWDAEVESEANDALIAQNLDHLVKSAVDTNFATTVQVDSVIGQLSQTADGGFDRSTDSLEGIYDQEVANASSLMTITTNVSNIQGRIPNSLVSGRMDSSVGAMAANVVTASAIATDAIGAAELAADAVTEIQAGLSTLTAAQVNAEVLDVLNVDTFGETSGVPSGTATLVSKLSRLYDALISGLDITSSKKKFKNAAGVAQWEKDLSDDGTTYAETAGNAP